MEDKVSEQVLLQLFSNDLDRIRVFRQKQLSNESY